MCLNRQLLFANSMKSLDSQIDTLNPTGPDQVSAAATDLKTTLPTPQDFPDSDVVIFDGKCNFCIGQVKNLQRFDGHNRLAFVSLHDSFVTENFPDLSYEQMMQQMYLIPKSKDGTGYSTARYGGARALRYLTRRLPKLWIFAPLLHIPFSLPLWQWLYNKVAERRYKIAGKNGAECDPDGTCELHFKNK